jgi:hypothetical protein
METPVKPDVDVIKVYQFERYNIFTDGWGRSGQYYTREAIKKLGKVLEDAVKTVSIENIGPDGIYEPRSKI